MKLEFMGIEPVRGHPDDVGFDLFVREIDLDNINMNVVVRTGTFINLPVSMWGLLKERSSVAAKGLYVRGGVIDPGYQGELIAMLGYPAHNHEWVKEKFIPDIVQDIHDGKQVRLVQLLLIPTIANFTLLQWEKVDIFTYSPRGEKGFGSTGR